MRLNLLDQTEGKPGQRKQYQPYQTANEQTVPDAIEHITISSLVVLVSQGFSNHAVLQHYGITANAAMQCLG